MRKYFNGIAWGTFCFLTLSFLILQFWGVQSKFERLKRGISTIDLDSLKKNAIIFSKNIKNIQNQNFDDDQYCTTIHKTLVSLEFLENFKLSVKITSLDGKFKNYSYVTDYLFENNSILFDSLDIDGSSYVKALRNFKYLDKVESFMLDNFLFTTSNCP